MAAKAENGGGRGGAWRWIGWGGAGVLLLAPLVAMQFTDEVDWSPGDFVFAALLMGGVGLGLELAVRRSGHLAYRLGGAIALGLGFLTIWINGAVGVIGDEGERANLLFLGVLAVALLGAFAARFRPGGMVWAMTAAAVAQGLVPLAAWLFGLAPIELIGRPEAPAFTVVFTGMWLVAAALFRTAAR